MCSFIIYKKAAESVNDSENDAAIVWEQGMRRLNGNDEEDKSNDQCYRTGIQ